MLPRPRWVLLCSAAALSIAGCAKDESPRVRLTATIAAPALRLPCAAAEIPGERTFRPGWLEEGERIGPVRFLNVLRYKSPPLVGSRVHRLDVLVDARREVRISFGTTATAGFVNVDRDGKATSSPFPTVRLGRCKPPPRARRHPQAGPRVVFALPFVVKRDSCTALVVAKAKEGGSGIVSLGGGRCSGFELRPAA